MTNAERLNNLLVAMGAATAEEIESREWSGGKCPYWFQNNEDGTRTLTVDKGDALGRATGATVSEILDKMEAKFGG